MLQVRVCVYFRIGQGRRGGFERPFPTLLSIVCFQVSGVATSEIFVVEDKGMAGSTGFSFSYPEKLPPQNVKAATRT